jgi:hypothetical protein
MKKQFWFQIHQCSYKQLYQLKHIYQRYSVTRRGDIGHRKLSGIPSTNSKTNSFQNRMAEVRVEVNFNKEKYLRRHFLLHKGCNFNCSKARE